MSLKLEHGDMALLLAKAAPLKPEIKLAQALSEYEAVLADS